MNNYAKVAIQLKEKEIIRSVEAFTVYHKVTRQPQLYLEGTYALSPSMTFGEICDALKKPIRQMVRMPETNWARRSANLLEQAEVATAEEYLAEWENPQKYQSEVSFPLPEKGTLEGYLFPDTYDFPPQFGAENTVRKQLKAFENKVMPHVKNPKTLYRTLIIASLVELEVAKDEERPMVAGVIENRLLRKMPLQIDAAINYGIQKWRPLSYDDLKKDGPYNTYRNLGLPPTPICSPSLKSIQAALNPARHSYLYYVAMPEKYHLFSSTFDEHRKNIAKRKAALQKLNP